MTVLPLAQRDDPTAWPWPFKSSPAPPGSVGVKVSRDDGAYFQVFIPPDGWGAHATGHRTVVTRRWRDRSRIVDWSNVTVFGRFLDRWVNWRTEDAPEVPITGGSSDPDPAFGAPGQRFGA